MHVQLLIQAWIEIWGFVKVHWTCLCSVPQNWENLHWNLIWWQFQKLHFFRIFGVLWYEYGCEWVSQSPFARHTLTTSSYFYGLHFTIFFFFWKVKFPVSFPYILRFILRQLQIQEYTTLEKKGFFSGKSFLKWINIIHTTTDSKFFFPNIKSFFLPLILIDAENEN